MSTEAVTSAPAPTPAPGTPTPEPAEDAFVEAGALLLEGFFPEKKGAEPAPEEAAAPEAAQEPEEPEESEAAPKPKEEKPAWQIALARKKVNAAKKYEAQVTQYAEEVKTVANNVKQQHDMVVGVIEGIKNDPIKAFDEICRVAGIDPIKGFERLARAKIGKPAEPEPEPVKSPEVEQLRAEMRALQEQLQQREQSVQVTRVAQSKAADHGKIVEIVDGGEYPFAAQLAQVDPEEYHNTIKAIIEYAYSDPKIRSTTKYSHVASAVNKRAQEVIEKAKRYAGQAPAPAKPATRGAPARVPTNRDAAEASHKEMSEQEAFEAAGDAVLEMFNMKR